MKKLNPATGKYEKYSPGWNCARSEDVHSEDRENAKIKCAYCGKEILYTDSFCSHLIQPDDEEHPDGVSGYLCCLDCIKKNEINKGVM